MATSGSEPQGLTAYQAAKQEKARLPEYRSSPGPQKPEIKHNPYCADLMSALSERAEAGKPLFGKVASRSYGG